MNRIDLRKRTIFNTPVLTPLFRLFSVIFLKMTGWKIEGVTELNRGIEAAGPHTSMIDYPMSAMMTLSEKRKIYWLGKEELFRFPFKHLCGWLGGIPVDRKVRNGMVKRAIGLFEKYDEIVLLITPEGTRGKTEKWRTGLLKMAEGANVPIVLGYLDYARKVGGAKEEFVPSGNTEADIERLRNFYSQFKGKNPQNQ